MSEDKINRIKRLKEAKKLALTKNQQEIDIEKRNKRLEAINGTTEDNDNSDHEHPNSNTTTTSTSKASPTKQLDEKSTLLSYTIKQTDDWNESHKNKKNSPTVQDYNEIAAMTYLKETQGLEIDHDSYDRQKKELANHYGISEHDDLGLLNYLKSHKPDPNLVKKLKDSYNQNNQRKLNRKRTGREDSGDDAFISRKNRDFNKKLARDYHT